MLTEGVHSLVDSSNQLLLMYGRKRAAKPADAAHPGGYGRELYFWSFVVALLVFALGAGVSIYEGAPFPVARARGFAADRLWRAHRRLRVGSCFDHGGLSRV
ncbi:MAG: cation transporter [Allosphingosinicella sp.]